MYSDWVSLTSTITANSQNAQSSSVLNKFPASAGREVTISVVKQLASNLGITQNAEPSHFIKDEEVQWLMDVICFGLSLPLQDHETLKDCVNVYCEWMTALHPVPRINVPKPITDDPNIYCRRIIQHFHNLFVPRHGESPDLINRQAVLCHRVLRTIQQTVQISQKLEKETWEALLLFLLAINDSLLAPPTTKDDVGDQLCERVLSVLFEIWLLACVKCFPSPSLWKTLQESCSHWRHRTALIEQWNRVNLVMTAKLIDFSYGPTFPELKIPEEDLNLAPPGMTNDCIAQTWYRVLRTIGSPTDLCSPNKISKTPQFIQWALTKENGGEPAHHPCLQVLPHNFLKAIKGISALVDGFLGIYQTPPYHTDDVVVELRGLSTQTSVSSVDNSQNPTQTSSTSHTTTHSHSHFSLSGSATSALNALMGGHHHHHHHHHDGPNHPLTSGDHNIPHSPTPPLQRRLAKSFSVAPTLTQQKGLSKAALIGLTTSRSTSQHTATTPTSGPPSASSISSLPSLGFEPRPPLAPTRPKCNSILHLFGEWLFEAAHIGGDAWVQNTRRQATEQSKRPSSMIMDNRKGSISLSQPNSLDGSIFGLPIERFESGKAEAIGALCRIFCSKKTGEEILPVYLARFYMALAQSLKIAEKKECDETLASILMNSGDLFRLDLDGIQVLLPAFIVALEVVLPEKDLKIRGQNLLVNRNELRRASINILLSIITLPLHFQTLGIRDLGGSDKTITFIQLKPRIMNILMNALQVETDAQNTHMLLGGLLLAVQDAVTFEEDEVAEEVSSPTPETNLLSSACSERSASLASTSGNSSIGGHSTATLGAQSDLPSLTISEEIPPEYLQDFDTSSVYDNAHALFVRATYLVCHRLISSWKTDLNVSLAALELLTGLARLRIKDSDALECKRAVKWICDYVCYQCSRPPPAHSKDLHSTIVAAFQCISGWLMQHPYLLDDKDCLMTVLEVVELGISGSKSIGKVGEPPKFKDQKELKPVSLRVKDAAENLLTIILEHVGNFPSECGPESLSSLLDEQTLVKYCNSMPPNGVTAEQAVGKFKYFVTDNTTILAILDEPLGNDQDPQPTVTLIIRSPFGRHVWTMQLRFLPRSKSGSKYHAVNPGRPVPMNETPPRQEIPEKHFPDGVDQIPPCAADRSIPTLDEIKEQIGLKVINKLESLIENQSILEKVAWAEAENSSSSLSHAQECQPPPVSTEFQATRLFLLNFGYLFNETDDKKRLIALDTKSTPFIKDLDRLDKLSNRTYDTVHVFYVKAGQSTGQEIISNMEEENLKTVNENFWHMLTTFGWPVSVADHPGWTGFINNSFKIRSIETKSAANKSTFNGEVNVLYWADVNSEIAFVVPNEWNSKSEVDGCNNSKDSSIQSNIWSTESSKSSSSGSSSKSRNMSLDLDNKPKEPVPPTRRKTTSGKSNLSNQASAKIMVVWLESYEDHLNFPIDELLPYMKTGEENQHLQFPRSSECHVIFLHALETNLLRVKLQGPVGRMSFATPLVDGMVLSRRVVGNLVRQTALNMARRRRLDSDAFHPPHVRRRLKIQEMIQKYRIDMTEPELIVHLFQSNSL
ncbi:RALGAPB family protein [Megaselia abdita]